MHQNQPVDDPNQEHPNQYSSQQDIISKKYRIQRYQPPTLLSSYSYSIIRPPRFIYNQQYLQQSPLNYSIQNHEIPFKLTLYKTQNMQYVVLYLHGNSSSRIQGHIQLRDLPENVGLACFDFAGCGLRFQTEYITLGVKQSKEVDIAAKYLKSLGYMVIGWGKSMGAVSLLISEELDVLVADSPFCSLEELCKESGVMATPCLCACFFHCLYPCLFSCVKRDIMNRANLDVKDLEVWDIVQKNKRNSNRSLFIMARTQDSTVVFHHSQRIFDKFNGVKHFQLFQGTHNSNIPQQVLHKCFKFIEIQLKIKNKILKNSHVRLQPISKIPQIISSLPTHRQPLEQQNLNKYNYPENKQSIPNNLFDLSDTSNTFPNLPNPTTIPQNTPKNERQMTSTQYTRKNNENIINQNIINENQQLISHVSELKNEDCLSKNNSFMDREYQHELLPQIMEINVISIRDQEGYNILDIDQE